MLCPRFVCSQLTLKTLRVCNFSGRQLVKLTWQLPSIYVLSDNESGLIEVPRTTGIKDRGDCRGSGEVGTLAKADCDR